MGAASRRSKQGLRNEDANQLVKDHLAGNVSSGVLSSEKDPSKACLPFEKKV